ncbi:zinc-ribbon domain-containing protein [Pediococcus inopinatus]|uniref:zinc-ribbon domain-containing protein n=1 Tax=Pediococcus inopinatus TaxID=114090 RepID=UPI0007C5665F|nr:zinc-ribbon domain-containing protein [Pediococcus inopinatus]
MEQKSYLCPQCHEPVEENTRACPNCGAKIDFQNDTYTTHGKWSYIIVGYICAAISIFGGVIAIAGSILCGYQLFKYKSTKDAGVALLVVGIVCGIIGLSNYF